MYPLSQVPVGVSYKIESIRLPDLADEMSLAAIGVVSSAEITKVRKTPFGDPVEYVLDCQQVIVLENKIADHIWVVAEKI